MYLKFGHVLVVDQLVVVRALRPSHFGAHPENVFCRTPQQQSMMAVTMMMIFSCGFIEHHQIHRRRKIRGQNAIGELILSQNALMLVPKEIDRVQLGQKLKKIQVKNNVRSRKFFFQITKN